MDTPDHPELAVQHGVPDSIGDAVHDFCLWRYGELWDCAGRESDPRELYGPAGLWPGDANSKPMVQSGSVFGAARLYVRRCGAQLGVWTSAAHTRHRACAQLPADGKCVVRVPWRGFQRAEHG